jgi:hypothetical protein
VLTETVEVDAVARLRGTVTVTDHLVRITTGSQPRLERLVGHVRDAVGDLEPVTDRRTRAWRASSTSASTASPRPGRTDRRGAGGGCAGGLIGVPQVRPSDGRRSRLATADQAHAANDLKRLTGDTASELIAFGFLQDTGRAPS